MAETVALRRWSLRAIFLGLVLTAILLALMPVRVAATPLPYPDLLVCLLAAWVLRRPDVLPPVLIAAVLLLCDFLFQRPPGLWSALVLAGTEVLRRRGQRPPEMPFTTEYGLVALVTTVLVLLERVISFVLLIPQPPLGASLLQLLLTLASYPLVVLISVQVIGVRPLPATEARIQGLSG